MLRHLFFAAFIALGGCAKSAESADSTQKQALDDWLVYEDNLFRASYPKGSDVFGAVNNTQDPKSPTLGIVPPPAAKSSAIGGLFLQLDQNTKHMLLRDAIQNEIKRSQGSNGILLSAPRDIAVKNGRCLGTIVISPTTNCEKNAGTCYAPLCLTQCDGPDGARYSASGVLSSGPARDSLSPQAKREAAVYERILRSLEFKKS